MRNEHGNMVIHTKNEFLPPSLHPTRCGLASKRYRSSDHVGPICDSIVRIQRICYGAGLRGLVKEDGGKGKMDKQDDLPHDSPFVCRGCGSTDKFTIDSHNLQTCDCGVVVGLANYEDEWKDLNGGGARGESAMTNRRDIFSKESVSRPVGPTSVSAPSATGKYKAAEALVRKMGDSAEDGLTPTQEMRYKAVIKQVEKFVSIVKPVPHIVHREVRITTYKIFCDSLKHKSYCKAECPLGSINRMPSRALAHKSLVYTVQKMLSSSQTTGVTKLELEDLNTRMSNNQQFQMSENALQHQAFIAVVTSLEKIDVCKQCDDDLSSPKELTTNSGTGHQAKDDDLY